MAQRRRRTYSITTAGDIRVIDWPDDVPPRRQDISELYQNIARDPKRTRIEASIDIEIDDNGNLLPVPFVNGVTPSATGAYSLLLELLWLDIYGNLGPPRQLP